MTLNGQEIRDDDLCEFDFSKLEELRKLPKKSGVYLWEIDNEIVYIGRAYKQTLYDRFHRGYGHITARPRFKKVKDGKTTYGQSTNLKMNNVVLQSYKEHKIINIGDPTWIRRSKTT